MRLGNTGSAISGFFPGGAVSSSRGQTTLSCSNSNCIVSEQ